MNSIDGLTLLGNQNTKYLTEYDPAILEKFANKNPGSDDIVGLDCFEFSSLCPITGQPDIASIYISYIPDKFLVESKSLKLYLFSFRNHGDFHEDCVHKMQTDLVKLLDPKYLEVFGIFNSRGGIAIYPFSACAKPEYDYMKKARQLDFMSQIDRRRR
jgi:7-cyano-7-deazaguanine reductase